MAGCERAGFMGVCEKPAVWNSSILPIKGGVLFGKEALGNG